MGCRKGDEVTERNKGELITGEDYLPGNTSLSSQQGFAD